MDHFAGLDVSVKETSICIVEDAGKMVREVKVASEPEALLAGLKNPAYHFKRIGLEAGPLSQWSRPRSRCRPDCGKHCPARPAACRRYRSCGCIAGTAVRWSDRQDREPPIHSGRSRGSSTPPPCQIFRFRAPAFALAPSSGANISHMA